MLPLLPSLRSVLRAALLLVVVICATQGRATAACGEYVTILNTPATEPHTTPAPITQQTQSHQEQTPVKLPCHGPNCSSAPTREVPPTPPAPTTAAPVKELARNSSCIDSTSPQPGSLFQRD